MFERRLNYFFVRAAEKLRLLQEWREKCIACTTTQSIEEIVSIATVANKKVKSSTFITLD